MEPLYEEYLTHDGTIVKPYFWLSFSLDCTNCPYHIRTGEEARVPYTEFQHIFGFPWSTYPQIKHLTFYELRSSSGNLIQKGHASNCTGNPSHPESMLFEKNGYLDSVISYNSNIRHIILYSNHSPCNEANHCCINKMYNFLMMYPDITLNIFFSQLYHTDNQFPTSAWNREALRRLASLWPQVTLSPISGDIWNCILENFVSCVPGVLQPFTSGRILADRYNAYEINSITGVKPYFIDVLLRQQRENQSRKVWATLENNADPGQANQSQGPKTPVVSMLVHYRELPPIHVRQNPQKPKNVVRHLNMPQLSSFKAKDLGNLPQAGPWLQATDGSGGSKEANEKNKQKWKK